MTVILSPLTEPRLRAVEDILRTLRRMRRYRNDRRLGRIRDRLVAAAQPIRDPRIHQLIEAFDDELAKRTRDGGIKRYAMARGLLLDAATLVQEDLHRA